MGDRVLPRALAASERVQLPLGGFIEHTRAFLDASRAAFVHQALVGELDWEQREIVLFGKAILQPRLIAWAGTFGYRYSGRTLEPRAPPPVLAELTRLVNEVVNVPFNHVLVNRYRDGNDSMGMHSDSEPELGIDPVVASLSFGVARRFVVVPRSKGQRYTYSLGQGDLLVMGGSCQAHYRHGIPREPATTGERVSVTFRSVLRDP